MALPASGQLAASAINRELRRAASLTFSIDTAENGGYTLINRNSRSRPDSANPAAFSEWYGYNHSAVGPSPTYISLPEIAYDRLNRDNACRNAAFGRFVNVWGDGPSLQDCTRIYANARGSVFAASGWYAENFSQFERFWDGSSFAQEAFCRL